LTEKGAARLRGNGDAGKVSMPMKNHALLGSALLLSLAFMATTDARADTVPVAPTASVVRPASVAQPAAGKVEGTIIRGFAPVNLTKPLLCTHVTITATSTEMTTCGRDQRACIPQPTWTRRYTPTSGGFFGDNIGKCQYSLDVPPSSPFTVTASSEVVNGFKVVTPSQPVPPTMGVASGETKLHNFPIRIVAAN